MKMAVKRLIGAALCVLLLFSFVSIAFAAGHTHSWGEPVITKEATKTQVGEITYICSECGEIRIETFEIIDYDNCYNPVFPICRIYSRYITIPLIGPLLQYFHDLLHLFYGK